MLDAREEDTMAHACGCRSDSPGVLDVRQMAAALGDAKITATVQGLASGEAFVLVTDHDPTPLLHGLERAGMFRRRHLEDGPAVWRIEIGRAAVGTISAEHIVGEVAHRHPGTLEVMQEMGINHCCGAQLTLAEAAATAGVPIDALLHALNETTVASV